MQRSASLQSSASDQSADDVFFDLIDVDGQPVAHEAGAQQPPQGSPAFAQLEPNALPPHPTASSGFNPNVAANMLAAPAAAASGGWTQEQQRHPQQAAVSFELATRPSPSQADDANAATVLHVSVSGDDVEDEFLDVSPVEVASIITDTVRPLFTSGSPVLSPTGLVDVPSNRSLGVSFAVPASSIGSSTGRFSSRPRSIRAQTTTSQSNHDDSSVADIKFRLASVRLKVSSFLGILISGFAFTALVEVKFGELPASVLVPYAVIASIQCTSSMIAFMMGSFIRPVINPSLIEGRKQNLAEYAQRREQRRLEQLTQPQQPSARATLQAPPSFASGLTVATSSESLLLWASNRSVQTRQGSRGDFAGSGRDPTAVAYDRFQVIITSVWLISTVSSVILFVASAAMIGYVRFYYHATAKIVSVVLISPFAAIFVVFAFYMYRLLMALELAYHKQRLDRARRLLHV
ncbi:hypothetical protein CAOG_00132 [Capsaspora owczarzaki ATCC 30864]|uniref:Transmembrane protein n=1 Tax=Capsaspora owczarzaki (strain ATCC 30864) TaxID=595528 RepID=A0A0D2WHZ7_CAPO3|nr:hypothetical protein CAOG_00132 [Capsaspora owczarzaki ATCC 30864]KJE88478.1 hypothetical protein CAOG_000132 [Capsaspora owczarzaki ATCC 30864]|eukprot:XP_004365003.1 hypothetical protein CAOG_00132 [Capsaspora owczarzaki ATCC 30864]